MNSRTPQPSYSGIITFMRAPYVGMDEIKEGQVAVVGVPQDTTTSSRVGCRYGPSAIRSASVDFVYYVDSSLEQELVSVLDGRRVRFPNEDRLVDVGDFAIYPTDIPKTTDSIRAGAYEIARRGAFPVALGGDHYVTYPLFAGWAQAMVEKGAKKLGYLQFDAHFDLGDRNVVWGTHWHGANARRISELDMIDPKNMAWVGVRGYARAEQYDFAQKSGMTVFNMNDVRELGIAETTRRALAAASKGCDAVYVTVDIDVVDCTFAPGTGASAFGGITPTELFGGMRVVSDSAAVGAFDIVEVAPQFDTAGITPRLASSATIEFLGSRILEIR